MKLLSIVNDNIESVTATLFKSDKNNLYYNIKLGTFLPPFLGTSIYLNAKDFPADENVPELLLTGSDYDILPIINKKLEIKKDKLGNPIVSLIKTKQKRSEDKTNKALVIVNVPFKKCTFKDITASGNIEKILEASNGYIWFDKQYSSPAICYIMESGSKIEYRYEHNDKEVKVTLTATDKDYIITKE